MMDTKTLLVVVVVGLILVVQGAPVSEQDEVDVMLLRLLEHVIEKESDVIEKKQVNVDEMEDLKQRATSFDKQLQSIQEKVMNINSNMEAMQRAMLNIADKVNDDKVEVGQKEDELDARQEALEEELGEVMKPVEKKSGLDGLDAAYLRELGDLQEIRRVVEKLSKRKNNPANADQLPYEK